MKKLVAMLVVIFVVTACHENRRLDSRAYAKLDELSGKNGCTACHSLDGSGTGPAWREVARKYSGKTTYEYAYSHYSLEDGLVRKASLGGRHDWGETIMRPNDPDSLDQKGVRQKDIRRMIRIIMELPLDK